MKKVMKVIGKCAVILFLGLSITWLMSYFTYASAESLLHEIPKRGVLRFGWATYWPYSYRDAKTNLVSGVSAELGEEMAKALNVKVEWVEDSMGTFPAGLQANKFDIYCVAAITLPRAMACGWSDALAVQGLGLLVKKAGTLPKSWKDLDKKQKKISVTFGANTDLYLTRVIKDSEIVRLKTFPEAFSAMMTGKVDAMAGPTDSCLILSKENPGTYVVPGEFARSPLAFSIREDDQIWINWVNQFVKEMKFTGFFSNLLKKYGLDATWEAK